MERNDAAPPIDILTLVAITIVAWTLAVMLHEVVGHAVPAILLGLDVRMVSTTAVDIPADQVTYPLASSTRGRILLAGGTVLNLLSGAIALLMLSRRQSLSRQSRYFLWLFSTLSSVIVTMNLLTATALGAGDWTAIVQGLEPKGRYVAIIIGAGILLAIPEYALPLRAWMPNLKGNRVVLLVITGVPVLVLTIVQVLSVLNSPFSSQPGGQIHLLASLLVCIHCLAWAILVNLIPVPRSSHGIDSIELKRSVFWLVAGILFSLFFVLVLGRGIGPFAGLD